MTTQEAKLKNDIPRKEEHNKFSELYFPNLKSTLFSILSGDGNTIETIAKKTTTVITEINENYHAFKDENGLTSDIPIQVEFTDDGFEINVVTFEPKPGSTKPKVNLTQIACLDWHKDVETLTILAKCINETVLQCTRLIPKLINNRVQFKGINLIETNPVYDVMVLVFSMYKMLGMDESLPGCYVQALMARKRITYNMLCHTLKYSTDLPEPIKAWFKQDNIVRKQDVFTPQKPVIQEHLKPESKEDKPSQPEVQVEVLPTPPQQWALHLIDYTGQKFTQKLSYQYSPKRTFDNDRFITIDGDLSITG